MDITLGKKEIVQCFEALNQKLLEHGQHGEILLCGGASMALLYDDTTVTKDVDAVILSAPMKNDISRYTVEIGEEYGLDEDWFNEAAKGFINLDWEREEIYRFSNLTVYSVSAEQLLAMKLGAARGDSRDKHDAVTLMKYLHLESAEQALGILEANMPGRILTAKNEFFTREVYEEYRETLGQRRLFIDMDGTLAVFTPVTELETLYEKGYFANLEPHVNVIEGIRQFMAENKDVETYVMSSYLADSRYALAEKQEWLDRYLPEIDRQHRIFPPCGDDKADFVPGGIRESDILLDDYSENLKQWEPPGIGLKLMNGINGTKGSWQGKKIIYDLAPDKFSSELSIQVKAIDLNATAYESNNRFTSSYPEEYKGLENDKDKKGVVMENNQINTVVVNAFGGPGVGKTTCSWEIASELKKQGLCVEYVSEYAKELVWDDNLQMLDGTVEHQKILLDEQEKRIQRLIGKADVVVTDSPLLLNLTYCRDCPEDYKHDVLERFNSYNNFCFLVKRDPSLDFENRGRIHNLEESIEKDKEIQGFLKEHDIYHGIYSHAQSKILVKNIMTSFNRLNQSQQKRYIEKESDMKNIDVEPTFDEKKGMFQSMSYEEQFKTVLEAEMPEVKGRDELQEDLYQEYMRSDQVGLFGNQLHKQFRDKIQEKTRYKVIDEDIKLE